MRKSWFLGTTYLGHGIEEKRSNGKLNLPPMVEEEILYSDAMVMQWAQRQLSKQEGAMADRRRVIPPRRHLRNR